MSMVDKEFQGIFGFDIHRVGSRQHRQVQMGVVLAKLRELAQLKDGLRRQADCLVEECLVGATPSFEEASKKLAMMEDLDVRLIKATQAFENAVKVAGGCQFSVSGKLEDYLEGSLPPEKPLEEV